MRALGMVSGGSSEGIKTCMLSRPVGFFGGQKMFYGCITLKLYTELYILQD